MQRLYGCFMRLKGNSVALYSILSTLRSFYQAKTILRPRRFKKEIKKTVQRTRIVEEITEDRTKEIKEERTTKEYKREHLRAVWQILVHHACVGVKKHDLNATVLVFVNDIERTSMAPD